MPDTEARCRARGLHARQRSSLADPTYAVTAEIKVGTPVALTQYFLFTVSKDGKLFGAGQGNANGGHPGMAPGTQIAAPAGGNR